MKVKDDADDIPKANPSELLSRISYLESKINELQKSDAAKQSSTQVFPAKDDKKQSELTLCEQNFFTLTEAMEDGVIKADLDDNILFANPRAAELLGYTLEELVGKIGYKHLVFEEDAEFFKSKIQNRLLHLKENYEIRFKRKDGNFIWVLICAAPVYNQNDEVTGTIGVFANITHRKNAELEIKRQKTFLEKIIENLPVSLVVKDAGTGIFNTWNKAAESIFAVPQEKAIGKTDYDFFSKEQAESFRKKDEEALEQRKVLEVGEQIIQTEARGEIIVNTKKIPIYSEKDEPESVIVFSEDITEKKKYEKEKELLYEDLFISKKILEENSLNIMKLNEELSHSEAQLKETLNTKNKFFAIIAHDLRSPIVGFLQLAKLLSEEINNITINDLSEISKTLYLSADKLYKLLENLLEWSFIQQTQIELVPKRISLFEVINDVFIYLEQVAKNKNISIETNIEHDTVAYADQNMLDSIFRNLISNAIKFSHNGGKIIVNYETSEKHKDKYVISVKDFGIGMESSLASNLFRIDKKTQRVGTQGEDGSGLGLILTKEFITRLNEEIWVESTVGEETTFYFTVKRFDFV